MVLALLAVATQAAIPQGYMFARDAETGRITVIVCPSTTRQLGRMAPAQDPHAGHGHHGAHHGHAAHGQHAHHGDAETPPTHSSDNPCVFAAAQALALAPQLAVISAEVSWDSDTVRIQRTEDAPREAHLFHALSRGPPASV